MVLTALQRSDLRSSVIDARLIAAPAWIARQHSVIITALKSDHALDTVSGSVSNDSAGRRGGHRRG